MYFNDVLKTLLTIEGVQQVQNLRLWMLSLDKIALSAHLTISEPNNTGCTIISGIKQTPDSHALIRRFWIDFRKHVTL